MFRGPHRTCAVASPGCDEIFGRRSSGASPIVAAEGGDGFDMAREGLKVDGKMVGRSGVKDVNVLQQY